MSKFVKEGDNMLIEYFSQVLYVYETVVIFDLERFSILWKGLAINIPLLYAQVEVKFVYTGMYNKSALVIVV